MDTQKSNIDMELVTPFVNGVIDALWVPRRLSCKSLSPHIKQKSCDQFYDIVAILNLVSPSFEGSLAMGFSKDVYLKIFQVFRGQKYSEIDHNSEDLAAELLEKVFKQVKSEFISKQQNLLQNVVATVAYSPKIRLKQRIGQTIVLPFEVEGLKFYVEVTIASAGQRSE